MSFLTATLGEAHWNRAAHVWIEPKFKPAALAFSLSPAPPSIHSLLLQKSGGAFYLLFWNDVTVWDGKTLTDINNPPVPVTVSFAAPVSHADIAAMNADGSYATRPGVLMGSKGSQALALAVPDSLLLVKIIR